MWPRAGTKPSSRSGAGSGRCGYRFKGNEKAPPTKHRHEMELGNLRAWAYHELQKRLEGDTLDLPPEPRLREELLATCYTVGNVSGKLFIEEKKHLIERLGRSPDRADAVAMACFEKPGSYYGPPVDMSLVQW